MLANIRKNSKSFSRRHSVASVNFGGKTSPPIDAENTEFHRMVFWLFVCRLAVCVTGNKKRSGCVKNFTKSLVNIPSVNSKVKWIIFLNFSDKSNDWLKNFSYFVLKSAAHQLVERL
jgi:hypothetical protein